MTRTREDQAPAPKLETARLRLEGFAEAHLTERYVGWLNDPEVVRYSEQRHRRHSMESCRQYARAMAGAGNPLWAIIAVDPDLGHIGNISANLDRNNGLCDVTILIGERSAWGRGLGTEAWNAVCDFMLGPAAMRKVVGGALASNTAMVRIMERSAMAADGSRPRHYLVDGIEIDVVYFARYRGQSTDGGKLQEHAARQESTAAGNEGTRDAS